MGDIRSPAHVIVHLRVHNIYLTIYRYLHPHMIAVTACRHSGLAVNGLCVKAYVVEHCGVNVRIFCASAVTVLKNSLNRICPAAVIVPIKCVYASDYLKRNTDSIRRAIDNDLFATSPNLEYVYEIAEISEFSKEEC